MKKRNTLIVIVAALVAAVVLLAALVIFQYGRSSAVNEAPLVVKETDEELEEEQLLEEEFEEPEVDQAAELDDEEPNAVEIEVAETSRVEEEVEPEPEPEPVSYELYSMTTDTVKLRSTPSTEGDILQVLGRRTILRVSDIDENRWAQVQTESGEEGYVLSDYLAEPMDEAAWLAYQEELASHKRLIVIDAGHQKKGNNEKEPVGPGASETKAKVSSGTAGVSTKRGEYEVVLEIALKLQSELEARGYDVIMCRTTNDVNISNSERAAVANDNHADAFIRIHIDGSEDHSVTGAHTICQSPKNKYNGNLYEQSKALAVSVMNEYQAATGCKKRIGGDGVSERDDLSGINWCQVPATLIELGFMSNAAEDELMSTADYQAKMVNGIANGIDKYFGY